MLPSLSISWQLRAHSVIADTKYGDPMPLGEVLSQSCKMKDVVEEEPVKTRLHEKEYFKTVFDNVRLVSSSS